MSTLQRGGKLELNPIVPNPIANQSGKRWYSGYKFQRGRTSVFDELRPGAPKTVVTVVKFDSNPRSGIGRSPIEGA